MTKNITRSLSDNRQKDLFRLFDQICYRHNRWNVWADFVMMAAISISNAVDKNHAESREKPYLSLAGKYNKSELQGMAKMFAAIIEGMDENPNQDFLGELFMLLNFGSDSRGQVFTPYNLCEAMARMTTGDLKEQITSRGWISVNDPACGAGATLIAFANECLRQGINYQTDVLFTAQDIDSVVACMCYIQLSLLGCPGYVVIDNTLTHPSTSMDERGLIPVPHENIWYTPMYFRDVWHWRQKAAGLDMVFQKMIQETERNPKNEKLKETHSKPEKVSSEPKPVKEQLTLF